MKQYSDFNSYFSYFFDFGIKNVEIPNELKTQGEQYFNLCFDKFKDKLGDFSNSTSSISIDLINLTFAFQYFCEKRLGVKPSYNGMDNNNPIRVSSHSCVTELNEQYENVSVNFSDDDLKESKKWMDKSLRYASLLRELRYEGGNDRSRISRVNIEISLKGKGGIKGSTEKFEIPSAFWKHLTREMENFFFTYRAQMYLAGSVSNHEPMMPIIMSMLHEPLVQYLRDNFDQFQNTHKDNRKVENLITALILVGAGFLKNSEEYKKEPEYKDEKEGVDPYSYYQYLYKTVGKIKTKKETQWDEDSTEENPRFSYGAIPLLLGKI